MSDKSFFKPTNLYKEYIILDLIEKNKDITQRELAIHLGIAVSMVNLLLDRIEKEGFLKRKKHSSKTVEYILTKKGIERKKVLNIGFLSSSLNIYNKAKENILDFINQITNQGFLKILLYGAGEVAEILLNTVLQKDDLKLIVMAIIDDDNLKQGKIVSGAQIISIKELNKYDYDGILVSSYTHQSVIIEKLNNFGINYKKILTFFG